MWVPLLGAIKAPASDKGLQRDLVPVDSNHSLTLPRGEEALGGAGLERLHELGAGEDWLPGLLTLATVNVPLRNRTYQKEEPQ